MLRIGLCCVVALTINLLAYTLGMCGSSVLPNDRLVIACEQQKVNSSEVVSDCPSISSLRKFQLHEKIPLTITKELTSALLNDERGFWFEHIRYNKINGPSTERINIEMFCRWLICYGKQPVTWNALIIALRDTVQLGELAERLIDVIPPKNLNVSVDCRSRPVLKYPIIDPPDILLLQHLNVSICDEIVGKNIKEFGTALLNDKHEHKMSKILMMHKRVHDINLSILEQWLMRNGKTPVTWKALIETLCDINELKELANDVQKLIHFKVMNNSALPFAHSEAIHNMTMILKNKYSHSEQPILIQNYSAYPITLQFYKHKEPLSLDEYIMNQISPKRLLITGQSYIRNEVLIWLIAREWTESRYRFSCQLLLHINLGKCKGKYHSLSSLLQDLKDHSGNSFDDTDKISKDIQRMHGEGFCMLLNCFHCKKLKRDFIYDAIYNGKLPNALCIIFSQPGPVDGRQLLDIATIHTDITFLVENVKDYATQIASNQCINGDMKHRWLDAVLKKCWRQPYLHVIVTMQ